MLCKIISPGSDGLISEFYKMFIDSISPILQKLYTSMETEQEVPESIATGLITILYKDKGSRHKLENYRPLSLLNTDYKILAKVLANRIKRVAPTIISTTQSYGVPGRDIADAISTIRDVTEHMKKEQGIVLSLDLNKAFDRVEHTFLFECLKKYGFGQRMRTWIQLLYNNANSRVKVNGTLTDSFSLERSVRQGCPMSAILYSITAEPLAMMIKNDVGIRGIKLPHNGESKIQHYADDITCTVMDMESVKKIIKHIEVYGKASGAKLNIEKSQIMYIGKIDPSECTISFKIAKEYIKILGINIGGKKRKHEMKRGQGF